MSNLSLVNHIKNHSLTYFLILTGIYLVLLSFQGIDARDEGWILSFYQQIFSNPETVEYHFLFYLSGLIGGAFYTVFSQGGILYFRLLNVIVILLTSTAVFHFYKEYLKSWQIILGCTFVILNLSAYGVILGLHHDYLTALFVVCSVSL